MVPLRMHLQYVMNRGCRILVGTKRSCWLAAYCEELKALRCEEKGRDKLAEM